MTGIPSHSTAVATIAPSAFCLRLVLAPEELRAFERAAARRGKAARDTDDVCFVGDHAALCATGGSRPTMAVAYRFAYSLISPKSTHTHGSAPTVSASWPGGMAAASPAPISASVPSSMKILIRPETQ